MGKKYGKSNACKNGKGGPWANDVYRITNPIKPAAPKPYTHLGCWKDTGNRAVPQIDGSDARIRGNYRARADAINKCYQVAREKHMVLFAVQHQGWCAAAKNFLGYKKYGKSNACKNGKGGPWANDVYRITNPIKPAAPKPYSHLGCWKDTGNRAVPQIDGSDARIRGNYRARTDAINKCYQVAR